MYVTLIPELERKYRGPAKVNWVNISIYPEISDAVDTFNSVLWSLSHRSKTYNL